MEFDFQECVKSGVQQAMTECELTIGMTLMEAVKKQVPQKVIIETEPDREYIDHICPHCKMTIGQIRKGQIRDIYTPKFHAECGQKLDWSEV